MNTMKNSDKKRKQQAQEEGVKVWRCPNCDGLHFQTIQSLPPQDYAGEREGKRFTSILRHTVKCLSCDQRSILTDYVFDASQWKE